MIDLVIHGMVRDFVIEKSCRSVPHLSPNHIVWRQQMRQPGNVLKVLFHLKRDVQRHPFQIRMR
jgi:hypothetical protein